MCLTLTTASLMALENSHSLTLDEVKCLVSNCDKVIGEKSGLSRRSKVCIEHRQATKVFLDGSFQRYCQQCNKFHSLEQFEGDNRGCRSKLAKHNQRQRQRRMRKRTSQNKPTGVGTARLHAAASATPSPNRRVQVAASVLI
uniref:Squamosa promoter binding protein-like 7 n=1 Tax=Tetraselmis sp. GSL018 TaxID=582737 RepID=A0A061RJQ3_9CHLO